MASLALDLSQFKSAGIYVIEVDQSERITVTTQALRLLPGFAAQGPYNSPVFIRSTRDRFRFYGDVDRKLERKGSFFQRSIDTALLQSPVFAINLIQTNNTPDPSVGDYIQMAALSLDSSASVQEDDLNNLPEDLYVNFFDRSRFWKPDTEYLQGVTNNKYGAPDSESAPLFNFVNLGTKQISFIVRKAVGLQGYDVLAKDWYGNAENIPAEWIRPNDIMADYFIQVVAMEGDWTDYASLSTDPLYSDYFNIDGIKPDRLQEFINLPATNLVGSFVGTIIPEFRDQTGALQSIEDIVNAGTSIHGILLNINKDALDELIWDENSGQWEIGDGTSISAADYQVDLVGHNLIGYGTDPSTSVIKQFLSYDVSIAESDFHAEVAATQIGASGKKFTIDASADQSLITVGTLVEKDSQGGLIPPGVTYIVSKIFDGSTYEYETAEPVEGYGATGSSLTVKRQLPIDDPSVATHYKFIKQDGLHLMNRHLPGYDTDGAPNAEEGVIKIYEMLEDPGILRGLTNPDMIQYRYVVDTMAYGLQPNMGGKVYLSRLAKKRGMCTAILSVPSFRQLAASQDPYFSDTFVPGVDPVPIFSTEWIPQGGNPDMPRSFRFTLPDEDNGARYTGAFAPYLRYTENGRSIYIPPAADISNAYVRKFLGGDPYAIVANQDGVLSNPQLSGLEYMIDQTDRDYLEPMGINSVIERPQTGQILIYANRTSFQTVKSDYNFLHVRELLNTLELQIVEALQAYPFQYNTAVTRLNIVNNLTPILEAAKDSGALFDYEVLMDESNNTAEIIDEGFGIVDVGVWINKGMEKIVTQVTVNRLGGVSSGGFALS